MKKLTLLFLILIPVLCFVEPTVVLAGIETVISTVRQPFGGSQSPDDARVAATAKAKREALEKAGMYIESLTIVKDSVVEKDEILALAAGVLNTEIVAQKNYATDDAFGIEVTARIKVDTGILEARVKKLLEDKDLLKKYEDSRKRESELLARLSALEDENKELKKASSEERDALKQKFQNTTNALTAVDWVNKALALRNYDTFTKDVTEDAIRYLQTAISFDNEYANAFLLLGLVYSDKGEYDRAIEYQQKALEIFLKTTGRNHPDTADSYNNLGNAYKNKGLYDRAIVCLQTALEIRLETLGPNHPDTAASYNNLGNAYKNKGLYDRAIEYHQKSLEIKLKTIGPNHPDTAASYNNLGNAYYNKREYDRAIEYYQKASEIKLNTLGGNHPSVANSYDNLGWAYKRKGKYKQAMEYQQKALEIYLETLGRNHPRTKRIIKDIERLKTKM